jgi:hypothetical protein
MAADRLWFSYLWNQYRESKRVGVRRTAAAYLRLGLTVRRRIQKAEQYVGNKE